LACIISSCRFLICEFQYPNWSRCSQSLTRRNSMSTELSDARASSPNVIIASLKSFKVCTEITFAVRLMAYTSRGVD
jgi:hypothetical protein